MAHVSIMETALWDVPRNEIIEAETPEIFAENRRYTICGHCVLVKDKKIGTILWDTGINPDWETEWPDEVKQNYSFHRLNRLEDKLAELGVTPNDIDLLICSHLHYDHGGNIKLFRHTKAGQKVMVSEAEAHEAFVNVAMSPTGVSYAYIRNEIIMDGIGYQLLKEDTWISDDIFLFIQRGHTPGVIGMLVHTDENGWLLFTSDGIYSKTNFGPPVVLPGLCVDKENYIANIERVRAMQEKYQALLILGHSVEDFAGLKKSPEWYM